jgi:hypothetical protein
MWAGHFLPAGVAFTATVQPWIMLQRGSPYSTTLI